MSDSDSDTELELDTSWITNYENNDNESDYNMFYKEDISVINLMVIYVNIKSEIIKIKEELLPLKSPNILIREQLLELIKNNNILQNTKYSLFSLLVYNITLDPEDLYIFFKSKQGQTKGQTQGQTKGQTQGQEYFQSIHNIDTIHFKPSISIFHDINQLTFIFREDNQNQKSNHNNTNTCNSTKKIYINHNYNNHTKTKRK